MRARRVAVLAAMLLSGLLLQVSVLPLVAGGGYAPDLLIVLVVVLTLEHGVRTGLWVAGVAGLLVDLSTTTIPLGTSMLVMVTAAYLLGLVRPYLSERADLTTAILAGLTAMLAVVGQWALVALLSEQPPAAGVVTWSAAIAGVFAVLLAPPVLLLVRRVLEHPDVTAAEVGR